MPNPGPASTITANYVNGPQNALRLIAYLKNLNVGATGDTALQILTAANLFLPLYVVTSNSSGTTVDVHLATVGVYTGLAQTGSTVLTTAALTGQTTQPFVFVQAPTNPTIGLNKVTTLFANVGTAVAGGLVDLYVYGFDLS